MFIIGIEGEVCDAPQLFSPHPNFSYHFLKGLCSLYAGSTYLYELCLHGSEYFYSCPQLPPCYEDIQWCRVA